MNSPLHTLAGAITEKFITADPAAAARALETFATHEVILLIGSLKAQTLVACLNPMEPAKAAAILRRLPLRQASYVLARLDVPQAARLMKEFSAPYRQRMEAALEPAFVNLLKQAGSYAPGSVGLLMSTDVVTVRTESKLAAFIERLKALPRKKLPAACFVTAKDGELKGVIRTAELAFYGAQCVCGSVMSPADTIRPQADAETARQAFAKAQADVLAVTDEKNILLGVLLKQSLPPAADKKSLWERLTQ